MANNETSSLDFSACIKKNIRSLAEGIKASSILPVGSARNNFNSCFPTFTSRVKPYSREVLHMVSTLLIKEGIKQSVETCDDEEKIDLVVDCVNKILGRVRDNLKILNGNENIPVIETPASKESTSMGSWNKHVNRSVLWKADNAEIVEEPMHVQKVLKKPQHMFEEEIDNTDSPFQPILHSKPNAVKPLAIYLERNDGIDRYCHPYMHELNSFQVPLHQLNMTEPVSPLKIDSGSIVFVDSEESIADMIAELKNTRELAIDLEYHNYRSFYGFTCLLQISSRTKDYIIDTIVLRSKLQVLNELFTDPNIVKVLHGANNDVIWLQKDLGLYLVNMFDTHLASTMLNFPRLNLAYLLKHYCNVDTDKRYQLFDWRIRPLPQAALSYAQSDTHYLLYIYDRLRNELIDKAFGLNNYLLSVYSRSTELCKKRYEKMNDDNGYADLYKLSKQTFDGKQMYALKLLYRWRDKIAREKDESTGYVLPNHMLMQIAEILPREMQGILACCNPVPTLVRQNLFHLHQLIAQARNQSINKISDHEIDDSIPVNKQPSLSKLKCPHDFSYHDDFRDNLETFLSSSDGMTLYDVQPELKLSVFDKNSNLKSSSEAQRGHMKREMKLMKVLPISPYARYKRTVEFEFAEKTSLPQQHITETSEMKHQVEEVLTESERAVHLFSLKSNNNEGADYEKQDIGIVSEKKLPENAKFSSMNEIEQFNVGNMKRKQNVLSDRMSTKKCSKYNDSTPILPSSEEADFCVLQSNDSTTKAADSSTSCFTKIKKKKTKKCVVSSCNSSNTTNMMENNFEPYDYAGVNFDKFVNNDEQKNLKALLNAKITFGVKKKDKNNKIRKKSQVRKK